MGFAGGTALVLILAPSVAAALIIENDLNSRSARYQAALMAELPVVAEQLGMLLSAGYSLASGINRVADRGRGAISTDLRTVVRRIGHGVPEHQALAEWASVAGLPALERLVAILALNREAGDLGALITEEARSIRRELHREVLEQIEKRSQTVWIPVTVATLVPGVIFLAIPFSATLARFGG
jgi:Flp pilus assembly protein TadB